MILLSKRFKNFLNVYYSDASQKFYLQADPNDETSKNAKFYPQLFLEVHRFPPVTKDDYTGKRLWWNK